MEIYGITGIAAITIICYVVAELCKAINITKKWLPVICGICGGILGVVGMLVMPEFPATDVLTAIAVGIVSGLAATGVNQIGKQLGLYSDDPENSD